MNNRTPFCNDLGQQHRLSLKDDGAQFKHCKMVADPRCAYISSGI